MNNCSNIEGKIFSSHICQKSVICWQKTWCWEWIVLMILIVFQCNAIWISPCIPLSPINYLIGVAAAVRWPLPAILKKHRRTQALQWIEDLSCYILDLHFSRGSSPIIGTTVFAMSTKFLWLVKLSRIQYTFMLKIGNLTTHNGIIIHQSNGYLKCGEIGFRLKAFCLFALFVLSFLFSLIIS